MDERLPCPKCKSPMESVVVSEYTVERCTNCAGLWFDLREHEHIAKSEHDVNALDVGDAVQGAERNAQRDVDCPRCHVRMIKLGMPVQSHIQYENCPLCHGAFLDAGELRDYADFSLAERVSNFFRAFRRKSTPR